MVFGWHLAPQLGVLFCTFETHQHPMALKIKKIIQPRPLNSCDENASVYSNSSCIWAINNHLKIFFYCCSITVVCIFSPLLYPTPAKPPSLPCFHPPSWFCPCVLYSSFWKPFSPLSLPPSPLAIVRLFLTSNLLRSKIGISIEQ